MKGKNGYCYIIVSYHCEAEITLNEVNSNSGYSFEIVNKSISGGLKR